MSNICTFQELTTHEQLNCGWRKGGISALGVLKADHGITDFSNATQTNDAITAGNLRIIKSIKGAFPAASPVEGENPVACGSETILDGFDFTTTWRDFNVTPDNNEFYRLLNNSEFSGLILYHCEDHELTVIERGVSFVALPAQSPESNKEKRFYEVTAKWSASANDDFPTLIEDAPDGIYN